MLQMVGLESEEVSSKLAVVKVLRIIFVGEGVPTKNGKYGRYVSGAGKSLPVSHRVKVNRQERIVTSDNVELKFRKIIHRIISLLCLASTDAFRHYFISRTTICC